MNAGGIDAKDVRDTRRQLYGGITGGAAVNAESEASAGGGDRVGMELSLTMSRNGEQRSGYQSAAGFRKDGSLGQRIIIHHQ